MTMWEVKVIDSRSHSSLIYRLLWFGCRYWWLVNWINILHGVKVQDDNNKYYLKKNLLIRRDGWWCRKAHLYMIPVSPQKICVSKIIWQSMKEAKYAIMVILKVCSGQISLTVKGMEGTIMGSWICQNVHMCHGTPWSNLRQNSIRWRGKLLDHKRNWMNKDSVNNL
jgi:hypothetical protein